MNLPQPVRCQMQLDGRWAQISAISMGLCLFLRAVSYLGLTNLNDLSGYQLFSQLIFPMAIAIGFLVLLKGINLNSPFLLGVMCGLYAVDYLLVMEQGEIVSAALTAVNAGLFLAVVLGFLQDSRYVILSGVVSVVYRVIFVDLIGYILPLSDWSIRAYLPILSNLFAVVAIAALAPALQLSQRRKPEPEDAN